MENEQKAVFQKIDEAIEIIKKSDLKKLGHNDYSNYDYYTPEQVDKLVYEACKNVRLHNKFELLRNELGIYGQLEVIDLKNGNKETYTMASDIPLIKATNTSQQLGGAMTYTKRYMLMNVYNIVDNNLDFDGQTPEKKGDSKKEKEEDNKKWLNKWNKDKTQVLANYVKVLKGAKEKGLGVKELREFYKISNPVADELEKDLKEQ